MSIKSSQLRPEPHHYKTVNRTSVPLRPPLYRIASTKAKQAVAIQDILTESNPTCLVNHDNSTVCPNIQNIQMKMTVGEESWWHSCGQRRWPQLPTSLASGILWGMPACLPKCRLAQMPDHIKESSIWWPLTCQLTTLHKQTETKQLGNESHFCFGKWR